MADEIAGCFWFFFNFAVGVRWRSQERETDRDRERESEREQCEGKWKFAKCQFCHSVGRGFVHGGRPGVEKVERKIFVLEEHSVKGMFGRGQNKSHFRLQCLQTSLHKKAHTCEVNAGEGEMGRKEEKRTNLKVEENWLFMETAEKQRNLFQAN